MRCCSCYTEHDFYYWLKLDFFGIWLINTLTVPASAFILFECHQYAFHFNLQYFYTILFVGYSMMIIIPLYFIYPHTTGWKCKLFAISFWILSMCCSSFHAVHLLDDDEYVMFLYGPIWLFFCFVMAFVCLYYQIPESLQPGYFDIYGSSHQWFHIFIAAAAIHWWYFLSFMSEYRDTNGCNNDQ